MTDGVGDRVRAHAFAKINLTLRVTGVRPDRYHELRTVFQSIALHDTLVCRRTDAPFVFACDDPGCAADAGNLVWRAAERIWAESGRRGGMRGAAVRLVKRIPMQAGLGGGSSDAAAALRALAALWRVRLAPDRLRAIAASLGADVPYFLEGGTALGLDRGDLLFPLPDLPPHWVVLVVPPFGVSTKEAFEWWEERGAGTMPGDDAGSAGERGRDPATGGYAFPLRGLPASELVNDLQAPVTARHPEIGRLVLELERAGAAFAAMSGSGSAVFGLFRSRAAAERAAGRAAGRGRRVAVTRTIGRAKFRAGA
ncbi:MAG: 4-(cytidine 5'-diphospho)-2-C-methyl-D-erythritol kinase [Betaproteobacteria bacterium]